MFKRLLSLVLAGTMATVAAPAQTNLYPVAGYVRAIYEKESVVSVQLENGIIFEFYAEDPEEYKNGDLCAMIIDNNGTTELYDDLVVNAVNASFAE